MVTRHKDERFLKAIEKENGVFIVMDYKYLESLKKALKKAFAYGFNTNYSDYYDVIDIENALYDIPKKERQFNWDPDDDEPIRYDPNIRT